MRGRCGVGDRNHVEPRHKRTHRGAVWVAIEPQTRGSVHGEKLLLPAVGVDYPRPVLGPGTEQDGNSVGGSRGVNRENQRPWRRLASINKRGFDYIWCNYTEVDQSASSTLYPKPLQANVEIVYRYSDYSVLYMG